VNYRYGLNSLLFMASNLIPPVPGQVQQVPANVSPAIGTATNVQLVAVPATGAELTAAANEQEVEANQPQAVEALDAGRGIAAPGIGMAANIPTNNAVFLPQGVAPATQPMVQPMPSVYANQPLYHSHLGIGAMGAGFGSVAATAQMPVPTIPTVQPFQNVSALGTPYSQAQAHYPGMASGAMYGYPQAQVLPVLPAAAGVGQSQPVIYVKHRGHGHSHRRRRHHHHHHHHHSHNRYPTSQQVGYTLGLPGATGGYCNGRYGTY
jgi:hypothetical protein